MDDVAGVKSSSLVEEAEGHPAALSPCNALRAEIAADGESSVDETVYLGVPGCN